MAVDLTQTAIDPADPEHQAFLADLQGGILKGHGRDYTAHLFIRFDTGNQPAARRWISDFARNYITTAQSQNEQAEAFKAARQESGGGVFANLFLTAAGYLALGYPADRIPRDSEARFNSGMKSRQRALGDPAVSEWQKEFQQDIHGLALLASDHRDEIERASSEVKSQLTRFSASVWQENGSRWYNDAGLDIEPFGYVDGVSEPVFFKKAVEKARSDGADKWDSSAPLGLVLSRDPNGAGEDSYGSFLVYRKLEQDVIGFQRWVHALASKLGVTPELVGAYAVGRFEDGTPVVLQDRSSGGPPENNFNYAADAAGAKCPFHSHVRKVNPRGDTGKLIEARVTLEEERAHRIVRRGVPFGRPEDIGKSAVGLLFLCFQGDIARQFEVMQIVWANSVQFSEQTTGLDPIIGQLGVLPEGQKWPKKWGDLSAGAIRAPSVRCVTLKGGDYFFAPSVGFLRNI